MANIYTEPTDQQPLTPESAFGFHCHPGLACFNQCCQWPTIILKPYDILRLRRALNLSSTAFLARYTIRILEDVSGLPLRLLALRDEASGGCPFLDAPKGCGVYADRPSACRLFPVVQGSRLAGAEVSDVYFLKKLDFCQGHTADPTWTLASWRHDQGLEVYDRLNQPWSWIMLQQGVNTAQGRPPLETRPVELALYDLDAFRRFVLESAFATTYALAPPVAALLAQDDEALLELGYAYARQQLGLTAAGELQAVLRGLATRSPNP